MSLTRSLPLLSAIALSACTVGPEFQRPDAPDIQSYAMAGDAQPDIASLAQVQPDAIGPWWLAFGSRDLDAVVREALAHNPDLAAADAALVRAEAAAAAIAGARAPQADLSAALTRERINLAGFGFEGPSPTITLYSVGPIVNFDLDLAGGKKRSAESAVARAHATRMRAEAAYLALTGNVVAEALRIAALRAQLREIDLVTSADNNTLDLTRRAIQAGGAPAASASTVEAQLAEDEAQAPPLRRQLSAARHRLALLVGKTPASWSPPDFELEGFSQAGEIPVSLPSALVRRRPDILAAEADLHAATADIGVAAAALYPRVDLNAQIIQGALSAEDLFQYESSGWSFGANLTAPLFHGKALKNQRLAAEAAAMESRARYEATVLSAFVQVSDLLDALAQDADLVAAQMRAADAAQRNLESAETAYRLGAGALLTVIDARRQWSRARLGLVDAQARLLSDQASLFVAAAADWRIATGKGMAYPDE